MSSIGQTPTRIPSASRSSLSFGTPSFLSSPSSAYSLTPSATSSTTSSRSFKSLRSLLPFGPSQNRERKGSLGSDKKPSQSVDIGRKSSFMLDRTPVFTQARKGSLQERSIPSSFLPPVISIDRQEEPSFTESVRRSISLTTLNKDRASPVRDQPPALTFTEPPPQSTPARPHSFREPLPPSFTASLADHKPLPTPPAPSSSLPPSLAPSRSPSPAPVHSPRPQAFASPSPSPPIADLSTIIEADSSGISLSKHIPSPSPAPSELEPSPTDLDGDADESHLLDLSTSHLDAQVRDAMGATPGWGVTPKEHLVEDDEASFSADISLDVDTISPDIAALLSPNNLTVRAPSTLLARRPHPQSSLPRLRPSSSATPPQQTSPGLKTASPGSNGRVSPRAPPSPLRASRPPPRNMLYGGEPILPARQDTPQASTSSIFPPPPQRSSSARPSLDMSARPSLDMTSRALNPNRPRKRSMSTTTPSRPGSSMSTPASVEWLGPRTAKAFKAAGLLDETPAPRPTHAARRGSLGDGRYAVPQDSKYTSPDPTQRLGTLSRFGSLRSDRSNSRMSSSRRSPSSLTESPRSASTAPTSVGGWDDEPNKHAVEMSALLGALSDSQRTARILREENTELRERLDGVERERDAFERERDEALDLLREREEELMARDQGAERSLDSHGEDERIGELEEENAILRSVVDDLRREIGEVLLQQQPAKPTLREKVFSPPQPTKRYSATSSIFPAPPANMSMLIADEWERDGDELWGGKQRQHQHQHNRRQEQEQEQSFDSEDVDVDAGWTTTRDAPGDSDPTWRDELGWMKRTRPASVADMSVLSDDNESEVSLRLKPEHEMHLGDMDGVSLYDVGSGYGHDSDGA